jgi:dihydrofolate reductase
MRKVVAGLFMTLDGVVESPGSWQEHFDEEMGEAMMEQLGSQDAVLLGRVTYQEWASYWPTATDEPFASFINSTPKYVFSLCWLLGTSVQKIATIRTREHVSITCRCR